MKYKKVPIAMTNSHDISDTPEMKHIALNKMALERHANYVSTARAILHLYQDEKTNTYFPFENLQHIFDLIDSELHAQNALLDQQFSLTGF